MNSKEPTRTQVLKQGPKPYKFPCGFWVGMALVALTALVTGLMIR